jgi:16S rRNA (guanine527-N7)-methyltransferase
MPIPAKQTPGVLRIARIAGALFPEHEWTDVTYTALADWLDLLRQWNRKIDLTAARTDDELFDLFIADAVVLHRARMEVGPSCRWVDVGSGAGAPGLAMAILDPSLHIDLAEPNAKRVAFLRQIIGRLGLKSVTVQRVRAEDLPVAIADDAVSRATFDPDNWLTQGAPLATQRVWMLLARETWVPDSNCTVVYDRSYQWPLTKANRRVIAVARAQAHSD